jgi:hypothetical protein
MKQMGLNDLFYFCFNKILKSVNNNYFYFILYNDLFKQNKIIFDINKNLKFYYDNFIFIFKITNLYIFYFFYFFFNLFYNLYIYKFIYELLFIKKKFNINKNY